MDDAEPPPRAEDLAPGDRRSVAFDWRGYTLHRIATPDDPGFDAAWERLWAEFGARGEMEARAVVADRLAWDPRRSDGDIALAYEIITVHRHGSLVAVRDHSVAVRPGAPVVVHLSHVLVEPAYRGGGLAGWLRALPLAFARRTAAAAGAPPDVAVVLVAEMEHPDGHDPARAQRLRSYERAGFRAVDPAAAPYAQPDFRPADVLGDDVPLAVPLRLVIRRVGREAETSIPAAEVRSIVDGLYAVYARHVPARALEPLRGEAAIWIAGRQQFELVLPTA